MKKTFKRYMRKKDYIEWKKIFLNEGYIGFNYLNSTTLSSEISKEFNILIKFQVEIPDKKMVKSKKN